MSITPRSCLIPFWCWARLYLLDLMMFFFPLELTPGAQWESSSVFPVSVVPCHRSRTSALCSSWMVQALWVQRVRFACRLWHTRHVAGFCCSGVWQLIWVTQVDFGHAIVMRLFSFLPTVTLRLSFFCFLFRAVPIYLLTKYLGTLYKHCYLRRFMVDVLTTILIRLTSLLLARLSKEVFAAFIYTVT